MDCQKTVSKLLTLLVLAVALSACVKRTEFRGYYFDEQGSEEIKPGMHVADVMEKFGSPTTSSAFGQPAFFYVHAKYEQKMFFSPTLTQQDIIAVYFSKDGKVEAVKKYTLADANDIGFSNDATIIEGNEMGIFEQIMGNVGRFSNERMRKPGL